VTLGTFCEPSSGGDRINLLVELRNTGSKPVRYTSAYIRVSSQNLGGSVVQPGQSVDVILDGADVGVTGAGVATVRSATRTISATYSFQAPAFDAPAGERLCKLQGTLVITP